MNELEKEHTPSKYEIFQFWKDKVITKEYQIVVYNHKQPAPADSLQVVEDWWVPECWACGEAWLFAKQEETLKQQWNQNSGNLQRAHIIPRQLGGENVPGNLFLLCPMCHSEAPNTRNPANFFAWVRYYRKHNHYMKRYMEYFLKAAEMLDIVGNDLVRALAELPTDRLLELRREALPEMGVHGTTINGYTMAFAAIDLLKKHGLL